MWFFLLWGLWFGDLFCLLMVDCFFVFCWYFLLCFVVYF